MGIEATLDWVRSGPYQGRVHTAKGDYYIWHATTNNYAVRFCSTEEKKKSLYDGEIIGRYNTVTEAKQAAEEHYAKQ